MTDDTAVDPAELSIPLAALSRMNRLGERGLEGVTERLRMINADGAEVATEWAKAGFILRNDVATSFTTEQHVGVWVHLTTAPGGYVLVLFGLPSANRAATLLLSDAVNDLEEASNDLAQSAVTEFGGMIAYGFVDGIADAVAREIDVSTPTLIGGTERELVSRTIQRDEQLGLYIASRFRLPNHDIETSVFFFPESEAMIRIVDDADSEVTPP